MKWRECAMLVLPCALALAGPPTPPTASAPTPARIAAAPARPVSAAASAPGAADAELLEFLGSVDSDEPGWHDYLEHTDLERVIHAPPRQATPTTPGNRT